ncbi:Polyketide synthase PksN [Aquisphaera giovannonii]|uniref:Polyketide synthase PksN n=1 Tax=Aquisphaera giovannonii TaxID=406548 RepID=A0A5B9W8Z6_9BACT|nr:beta-ketoacyl synthase N-terminal-like domain-containing protein [Aquisphaera giovannonii]QEH37092.1 Polyketide synthase PksN [Aquisphaera giovannonii]
MNAPQQPRVPRPMAVDRSRAPVAIVAYAGFLPGGGDLDDFWGRVVSGIDATSEIPDGRWLIPPADVYDPSIARPDRVYSTRGGFVPDIPADAEGLDVDPAYLDRLDPGVRLALVAGRDAWRAARTSGLDRKKVGVILGHIVLPTEGSSAYSREVLGRRLERTLGIGGHDDEEPSIEPWNAFPASLPAALLARALGLGGEAYTLDAACASSLFATKLAVDALQSGRVDAMITGGHSRPDPLYTQMGFSQLKALSSRGKPAPFDASGDGLVVGEGTGLFVLKRLSDALRDGDRIHGLIRGTGVSNDVHGDLLAPSSEGQLRAMRSAYEQAGWSPSDVDLIECHATGTPVGDAVELESLRALWDGQRAPAGRCVIGSVKSNVGHMLTAAGAAGLIKLLLALEHQTLPPTANQLEPNPRLKLEGSPFRVLNRAERWERRGPSVPRRAAISGFGFGGTNAHLLIEEWLPSSFGPGGEPPGGAGSHFLQEDEPASLRAPDGVGFRPPRPDDDACPVAIVGISAQFGEVAGLRAFQEHVLNGGTPGTTARSLDGFSVRVGQFRIPPRELEEMLPQQSLMLKVAADAIADARRPPEAGPRTGVVIGLSLDQNTNNYQLRWWLPGKVREWNERLGLGLSPPDLDAWAEELRDVVSPALNANRTMGSLGGLVASRIAREFRFGGPSFSVSADEASGTRAMKLAAGWLAAGELDAVVIGAVDLPGDPRAARAAGSVGSMHDPGEGAVALVLKRLADARRDGDRVYAVVGEENGAEPGLTLSGDSNRLLGWTGAAAGLAAAVEAAICLYQEVLPATADEPPRYWLRNRSEGPRRAAAEVRALDGRRDRIVLESVEQAGCAEATCEAERRLPLGRRAAVPSWNAIARRSGEGRLPVAFVYPGLGNVFPGMGRDIATLWPEVLRSLDARNDRLRDQFLPEIWWRGDASPLPSFADHRAPILGQVTAGSLMTEVLLGLGISPSAAIGYSMGESTALVSLGAWVDRDEMTRRLVESPLFATELAGPCEAARRTWGLSPNERVEWVAGIVPRGPTEVEAAIRAHPRVYLLIKNAADESVIGGQSDAVRGLVEALGCPFVELPIVSTVHCEVARCVEPEYRALHDLPTRTPDGITFYRGVSGEPYRPDRTTAAEAITAQATGAIDFPAVIERAYADGIRVFLEMGPGASCTRLIEKILGNRPHLAVPTCLPNRDGLATVREALKRLAGFGIPVDPDLLREDDGPSKGGTVGPAREIRSITIRTRYGPYPPLGIPRARPAVASLPSPDPISPAPAIPTMTHDVRPAPHPLTASLLAAEAARVEAHGTYLGTARGWEKLLEGSLSLQFRLIALAGREAPAGAGTSALAVAEPPPAAQAGPPRALDRDQCLEFAIGSIARVLGPDFAPADDHPTRVRLPDEPLMLVDRIVAIEGQPLSMGPGRVVTEHDVLHAGWYLDANRIPPCIAIEAGQADLFLSGYLGIDFETRGLAVYRLLDATVTFHRGLPTPGAVIRYDIRITRFFRQGETHLFRFEFDGTVDGQPLLTMRDGCAGFFSEAELYAGKGIVPRPLDARPRPGIRPADWTDLVPMAPMALDESRVEALRRGDLGAAFGPPFDAIPPAEVLPLPGGRMTLVHRVEALDPTGGRFGLGIIRGEADIHPGDWFMVCHFVDDRVMPGTLMYECCLHTLRIFLMRLGWVGNGDDAAFEPIPGVASRLRCRGQVTESTRKVTYEVSVKELGYGPEPYAVADALMYADGRPIVEVSDMTLRLTGASREGLERMWTATRSRSGTPGPRPAAPYHDNAAILAFSTGKPSAAFGERYRPFDEDRFIARLPAPPYQFLDRIVAFRGEPFTMAAGTSAVGEYDVPPDAWYFEADRQPRLPYAVLLEAALQTCGWTSAAMGSALASPEPLKYRNLGGNARQHRTLDRSSGTIRTDVAVTKVTKSAGMILQHFDFAVRQGEHLVFDGSTYFGFFHPDALAEQAGVREATRYELTGEERAGSRSFPLPDQAPFPDRRWRMVDRIEAFAVRGGPHGLGVIEGRVRVDPSAWFFAAHFLGDPVWPGSLGLESLLQLLKVVSSDRWGAREDDTFDSPALGTEHRWVYRGQVLPTNGEVSTQAVITHLDDERRTIRADGILSVDGKIIYQMNDFALHLCRR